MTSYFGIVPLLSISSSHLFGEPFSFYRYQQEPKPRSSSGIIHEHLSDTVSLASRNTSLRHKGLLWKFSYKLNHPEYDRVSMRAFGNDCISLKIILYCENLLNKAEIAKFALSFFCF